MASTVRQSSGRPLRTESPTVSWFELFYDLVVVAAVSLTNDVFLGHPSATTAFLAALSMTALAWVWFLTTLYNNMYPSPDLGRRALMVLQMGMIVIAGLAVDQEHGVSNMLGLAAYGCALLIVAALNLWGSWLARTSISWVSVVPLLAAAAICFVGWFSAIANTRYFLMATLVISMVPILTRQYNRWRNGSRLRLDHLRERLGLFVLIVLGEGFAQLVTALHYLGAIPRANLFALLFLLAFAVWWIYFDGVFSQHTDLGVVRWRLTLLAHLTLIFGIAGTLDILVLLTAAEESILGDATVTYFVVCLATVLFSFAALTFTAKGRLDVSGWIQLACGTLILVVGFVLVPQDNTSTYLVIGLSAAIVIFNAIVAVWVNVGMRRDNWWRSLTMALRGEEPGPGVEPADDPPSVD
jgi:low temperature requirement protein LtrA